MDLVLRLNPSEEGGLLELLLFFINWAQGRLFVAAAIDAARTGNEAIHPFALKTGSTVGKRKHGKYYLPPC
jgi:hypothetical protein